MAFSADIIKQVWLKTASSQGDGNESNGFRKDQCSAWIKRSDYGNRNSSYGWEIDHIKPVSDGGTDILSNLRALHWKNNVVTSDGRLSCPVKSNGNANIGI